MQIKLTSIYVDDQDKALKFYTDVLGFVKKMDFSAGKYRWLTVVSPEEPEGVQLVQDRHPHDQQTRPAGQHHGPGNVGDRALAERVREVSLALYESAAEHALRNGIIEP